MYTTMHITIGDQTLSATLEDNSSAHALAELLQEGPLTIDMHDYGNMEKVGPIGQDLPRNDAQTTTQPGDVILYLGNQLTIYYDTNSWSFTRVARIDGATKEGLLDILGTDDVTVTFFAVRRFDPHAVVAPRHPRAASRHFDVNRPRLSQIPRSVPPVKRNAKPCEMSSDAHLKKCR